MPLINRRQSIVLAAASISAASWDSRAQTAGRPPALQLVIRQPPVDSQMTVRLASLAVSADVVGSVAKTQVDMVFFNPNPRVLEGELRFPLAAGQVVTGFALDVQGLLRSAVPVPKAKGRQVFDDITREQVDPALLQTTEGNNYSLRVYPIPAGGMRRVRLEIMQALSTDAGRWVYTLPLAFAGTVGRLELDVRAQGVTNPQRITAHLGAQALKVSPAAAGRSGVVASFKQDNVENPGQLTLRLPRTDAEPITTAVYRGKTYFYAEVPGPRGLRSEPRPVPSRVGLVWDASGSMGSPRHRDHFTLLDRYFAQLRDTEVLLRVVRDVAEPVQRFVVRAGNWTALNAHLQTLVYDGATDSALLAAAPEAAELTLVVTDGLFNYGQPTPQPPGKPTLVINPSTTAKVDALRQWAEGSGGGLIDLPSTALGDALRQLTELRPRITGLSGVSVDDLLAASPYGVDGHFRIAGVLTAPVGELRVTFSDAKGRELSGRWVIHGHQATEGPSLPLAPHQWATLKVQALMATESMNLRELERLGMHFRIPTSRTSLIVLENARDYVRHGIEPPSDEPLLAQEVEQLARRETARDQQIKQRHLEQVTRQFDTRQAWWQKDYPTQPKPQPTASPAASTPAGSLPARVGSGTSERDRIPMPAPPAPMAMSMAAAASPPPPPPPPGAANAPSGERIQLKRWQPNSIYARRMREAPADDVYRVYLDERPSHANSTAFFLDAADILLSKQQTALAARVLSNLAEMNLQSRHILRILAFRLMQLGATATALPLLEQVLSMAPDEPQSWRDLALAQAKLGQHQAAVDNLWHVVSNPWHNRFPGIEMTALAELNAIVDEAARAQKPVDTQQIPQPLLTHLPVGLRVTLAWDADNTDIDLHVVDPHGEEAFYKNRLTHIGGAMSPDFTGGYGPEEFVLKRPIPGKYKVRANFYGHTQQVVTPYTTLLVQLFTGFGTPQQKMEQIVLRLSGRKEMLDVGEFEFTGATGAAK